MKSRWLIAFAAAFLAVVPVLAVAAPFPNIQQDVGVCDPNFPTRCLAPDASGNLPVTGTFSATLGGFAPNGNYATLAVSNSTGNVALPAGVVVLVQNIGATTAYVNLGTSNAVTATTAQIQVPASSWIALTVGSNTYLAGITASSTTTLTLIGGAGLATGAGGGGGGGAASTVAVDQTTPGTTNGVSLAQVGATTVATGSGAMNAGTQRVALATDSPGVITTGTAGTASSTVLTVQGIASMTKLLVTPDSVALPANQSVNLAQVAGTNTVNGGVAGSQSVGGTVATNVAITANPINLGAQAVSSENSAATTARQVQLVADLVGKLIVLPYANPENFVTGTTAAMTGTTSTSLVASPGGSLRNYITQISCVNSHATVGTFVTVQDGSGGTALLTLAAAAVYGGETVSFPTPLRQPTTATALFVADVTTGANVICSATGYKGL